MTTVHEDVSLKRACCTAWTNPVARSTGYLDLLDDAGFGEAQSISLDDALLALIDQIRRRLALVEVALTARGVELAALGMDRDRLEVFRDLAGAALDVIRDGGAGYRLFHATKQ